jgi:hypothetical protein
MSYHTDAHRGFYTAMRRAAGAPVMLTIKHNWGWVVEVKNTGELLFDQLDACCAWCAKTEGVMEWIKRRNAHSGGPCEE